VAKKTSVPPDKLELYERLLAAAGDLVGKSNFGSAYTAVNGNMYSMISKHGVVGIRLPDAERAAFLDKYRATIFRADPAWPPAKEYVAVPDDLLERTAELAPYLELSYRYAQSLKPKPTKKAKRV
jgi:TfoX/Sxy family transcriptional regulator of competence genes